ncbi:MAG: AMP-binding protein [Streptosporangiaceae bacterium]
MYSTIPVLLNQAAERHSDRAWLRTDDVKCTFSQAASWVAATSQRLLDGGVSKGDVVAFTARNTAQHAILWLGITCSGAIALPLNPGYPPTQIGAIARQAGARLLVCDDDMAAMYAGAADRATTVTKLVSAGPPAAGPSAPTDVGHDDLAVLISTSGTTGRSKLVMQTHRAYAMAGEGFPYWMQLTSSDRLMTSLPLFHVNAPAYSMLGSLAAGAGFVLLPRFSASTFLDSARRFEATEFNAIGAMLEILMRQPERDDDHDNPLRSCYTGPAPARERHLEIEKRFGLRISCGYALSESPYGLFWPVGTRMYGTLGTPRQHPDLGNVNDARAVDDTGTEVPVGASGELALRNPAVFKGYLGMPEETARVLHDGWLYTGDLVNRNEDGSYTFLSRIKEIIRRRGENLSPLEVEEALTLHPQVIECAVVGVPSELSEEEVKAFVVLSDPAADLAAIRTWLQERLAAFKIPRYWEVIDELPRTPTRRVAKHMLPAGHTPQQRDLAPS